MESIKLLRKNEIILSSITTFILKFFSFSSLYIINFIIAKNLGSEELGIFSLFLVFYNLIVIIGLLGLDTGLLRFIPQYNKNHLIYRLHNILNKSVIVLGIWSAILIVILLIISSILLESFFSGLQKDFLFYLFIIISPLIIFSKYYSVVLRGFKSIGLSILFDNLLHRVLILFFLLTVITLNIKTDNLSILTFLLALIVGSLFILPIGWKIKRKNVRRNGLIQQKDNFSVKEILKITVPMFLTSSMLFLAGWTDSLMIASFLDSSSVGVYTVCLQLSFLINFSLIGIHTVITPKFSELFWNNQIIELKNTVKNSAKFTFWSSVPILIILVVFSKDILGIYGDEFEKAYLVLIILCSSQLIRSCIGLVFQLLNMTGHEKITNRILIITLVINILTNAILIPIYDLLGAAIATFVSNAIRDISSSYFAYKKFKFPTWYLPSFKKNKVL